MAGSGPMLRIAKSQFEDDRDAMGWLTNMLIGMRWVEPSDPGQNPRRAALVLLGGWPQFRVDFVNDLQKAKSIPGCIANRITDPDGYAWSVWLQLRAMIQAWCERKFVGLKPDEIVPLKTVVQFFDDHYVPPDPEPSLETAEFEMVEHGQSAGVWDCFRSSGMVRKGTLHEIADDIADERQRNYEHAIIDDCVKKEKEARA